VQQDQTARESSSINSTRLLILLCSVPRRRRRCWDEKCGPAPGEEVRKVAEGISQEGKHRTCPQPQVALIALDPRTGEIKASLAGAITD